MSRRSGDEEGYWDAIGEEEEGPHLFWVPAHLHPEIAPSEFRAFLKEHARAASDEGSDEQSDEGSGPGPSVPFPGPARALSTGVTRKKSMLSRQYRGGDDDEQPVRRSRSSIYGGPQLTITDLQKIDELAQDADPAKLRAVLRRSLSLNVAPSFLDKADALPDADEADSPIIVPRPGQILRRAARTKIRKPNLPGDGGGHRFPSTRRRAPPDTESEQSHPSEPSEPSEHHVAHLDDWPDRPLSYTDESTIFDAYADRRDSMTSLASDDPVEPEPELHHPAPRLALPQPAPEPEPESTPQRTPSPVRSHSASPASSDLHLPQSAPRKEKKGGLFGMGKKSKKDKDAEKDKDTGFFGSLFGGSRSKKPDDSSAFASGQAAAVALLGASKSKSPAPTYPNQPPIQPSPNGTYARYPIHVERAVYRLSHIKLANPRRPLYEQVLISNLMFWYLGVINKQQQEEKDRAAEKEREEKDRKEKEKDKRGLKSPPANSMRKAETPVRGPQYEMQNRQMAEEYTQQQRPQSAPPTDRQYHLPARQQQRGNSAGDAEFGYTVNVNGSQGLPPGPHSPQAAQLAMAAPGSGGYGPYPPMPRPKSAGKGSSAGPVERGGSLGSRRPKEASEDDVPLDRLGGSLGRRGR